jgi:septal ring factor EnvC (AmiA/AmiB activator)
MLIRITLIVAILAGLGVVGLNVSQVRTKITTLIAERDDWHSKYDTTYADLTKTKSELGKTKTTLAETQKNLESVTAEKDKAVKEADAQSKRAGQLADELAKTKKDRDDAQADLAAFKATGFTAPQVLSLGKTLKQAEENLAAVQDENKVFARRIERLEYQLAKYQGSNIVVYLPANLKGKILVSDPKWDFVVLDVGEDQGAREDGELLVNRDGQLVAKVIIRSVQKNRCIANVMPGWKLGEVMEGDQVIPAHPTSS